MIFCNPGHFAKAVIVSRHGRITFHAMFGFTAKMLKKITYLMVEGEGTSITGSSTAGQIAKSHENQDLRRAFFLIIYNTSEYRNTRYCIFWRSLSTELKKTPWKKILFGVGGSGRGHDAWIAHVYRFRQAVPIWQVLKRVRATGTEHHRRLFLSPSEDIFDFFGDKHF